MSGRRDFDWRHSRIGDGRDGKPMEATRFRRMFRLLVQVRKHAIEHLVHAFTLRSRVILMSSGLGPDWGLVGYASCTSGLIPCAWCLEKTIEPGRATLPHKDGETQGFEVLRSAPKYVFCAAAAGDGCCIKDYLLSERDKQDRE